MANKEIRRKNEKRRYIEDSTLAVHTLYAIHCQVVGVFVFSIMILKSLLLAERGTTLSYNLISCEVLGLHHPSTRGKTIHKRVALLLLHNRNR